MLMKFYFYAKVNPFLPTSYKLTDINWSDISLKAQQEILKKAIKNNGTTLSDMTYVFTFW